MNGVEEVMRKEKPTYEELFAVGGDMLSGQAGAAQRLMAMLLSYPTPAGEASNAWQASSSAKQVAWITAASGGQVEESSTASPRRTVHLGGSDKNGWTGFSRFEGEIALARKDLIKCLCLMSSLYPPVDITWRPRLSGQ